MSTIGPLAAALPQAIRPRFVHNNNGLRMHLLEAGFEESGRPCVVLLHGFPELAYSWRKIMMPLASAGFHVIAPDQRGYGRTTGWDPDYDGDLASFRIQNPVTGSLWRSGTARCMLLSVTISALRWPPTARSSGRMCSDQWC